MIQTLTYMVVLTVMIMLLTCIILLTYKVLDRIDLQIEILPVSVEELTHMPQGEPSAVIRERVIRARKIQEERFSNAANANDNANANTPRIHTNAQMTPAMMKQFAPSPKSAFNSCVRP